jgi:hypothetical protein
MTKEIMKKFILVFVLSQLSFVIAATTTQLSSNIHRELQRLCPAEAAGHVRRQQHAILACKRRDERGLAEKRALVQRKGPQPPPSSSPPAPPPAPPSEPPLPAPQLALLLLSAQPWRGEGCCWASRNRLMTAELRVPTRQSFSACCAWISVRSLSRHVSMPCAYGRRH